MTAPKETTEYAMRWESRDPSPDGRVERGLTVLLDVRDDREAKVVAGDWAELDGVTSALVSRRRRTWDDGREAATMWLEVVGS